MSHRVLVVQHGQKERRPGDPGLTQLGRDQARATADWLSESEALVAVRASPLLRAVETATPIGEVFGLAVSTDRRLRERMNWDDPQAESLEGFLEEWQRTTTDRSYVPQSGDSSNKAAARFIAAVTDLVGTYENGVAAVVAHGGVTVDVLRTLLGDRRLSIEAPTLIDDGVPCCAITGLRHDSGQWSVDSLPSTAHLDEHFPHQPA